jgi:HlyD family type I secretion membrane fusion protein
MLPAVRRRTDVVGEVVGAFESDTVAVFVRTAPGREHITLYAIAGMLVLAAALTTVVKIDAVVSGLGRLIPTAGEIYVAAYNNGIITRLNVKVGDVVKKGQALANIDPTFTQADLVQMKEHMASDAAAVAREEAELASRPYQANPNDHYSVMQGRLWKERHLEYTSTIASYDAQIRSTAAQVSQYKSDTDKYGSRLKLAAEVENTYEPLLEKGYVSKLQLMQATDTRTEMSRLLADAENMTSQFSQTLASLQAQRDAYIRTWWSTTANQLVLDKNDLELTRGGLEKAQKLQDLVTLDAPEDAIVTKIAKFSPGAVVQGGGTNTIQQDPLFTLVPLNAPVEAEIDVATAEVGFIHVKDPVQLKLDAYPFIRHGLAHGVVKTISEDSFTLDINNQPVPPYYKIIVTITDVRLHSVPSSFRLIPGSTLTGDVTVNSRTIFSYLSEGLLRTAEEAMREPY